MKLDKQNAFLNGFQNSKIVALSLKLQRAALGNLGDYEAVGEGVSELRIFEGKGYRVYFTIKNKEIIFMLCGGDKSSQDNDIKLAKKMRSEL